jgi:hypothetical protein
VVKNNILLTVLVASFAAPVFASLIPKSCPLNEQGKFLVAVAAVDAASSRLPFLNRYPSAIEVSLARKLAAPVASVLDASGNMVAPAQAEKSLVARILNTNVSANASLRQVSVDVDTVGVRAGVTFNVVPLAVKAAVTYVAYEAVKAAHAKFSAKK